MANFVKRGPIKLTSNHRNHGSGLSYYASQADAKRKAEDTDVKKEDKNKKI